MPKPSQPIAEEPSEVKGGRLPTTYLIDTLEDDRQTQLAASVDIRNDGTLTFHDDDGAIVAAYHRDHWRRVQSERQSHATPSA